MKSIEDIYLYCNKTSSEEDNIKKHIKKEIFEFVPHALHMSSDNISGLFLSLLVSIHKPNKILEIGSFLGYGTHCLTSYSPVNSKTFVIEKDINTIKKCKEILQKILPNNDYKKITFFQGLALEILNKNLKEKKFDFIFIDADKVNYANYVIWAIKHLNKNGIMVLDNSLCLRNMSKNSKKNEIKMKKIDEANIILKENSKLLNINLPIRDGIHIAIKL